jgi:hypothetical protein
VNFRTTLYMRRAVLHSALSISAKLHHSMASGTDVAGSAVASDIPAVSGPISGAVAAFRKATSDEGRFAALLVLAKLTEGNPSSLTQV